MLLTYEVTRIVLPPRLTAVVRGEMPRAELPAWLISVFPVVHDYLRRGHIPRTGHPFARFSVLGHDIAVEAGFPVPDEVSGDGVVEPSTLPGGPAAVTVHLGPYEDLDKAYAATRSWVLNHGYTPAGPHWEIYYTNPEAEPEPARWRTDLVMPYRAG